MRVRVRAEHGQFYACMYGRHARGLKGRRGWRFWLPEVAGMGATPGAAITQLGELVEALERYEEVADSRSTRTMPGKGGISRV